MGRGIERLIQHWANCILTHKQRQCLRELFSQVSKPMRFSVIKPSVSDQFIVAEPIGNDRLVSFSDAQCHAHVNLTVSASNCFKF